MFSVLKTLFYAAKKEKQILIALIAEAVLLVAPLIFNAVLNSLTLTLAEGDADIIEHMYANGVLASGRLTLFGNISADSLFSIILYITVAIMTVREFKFGAIRGKILSGRSRAEVFFGTLLWGEIFTLTAVLSYSLLGYGLGTLFLGYGRPASNEAWLITYTIVFGLLENALRCVLIVFLSFWLKSTGKVVIAFFVVYVGLGALQLLSNFSVYIAGSEAFFRVFNELNPVFASAETSAAAHTLESGLIALFSGLVYSTGLIAGGYLLFRKTDLK